MAEDFTGLLIGRAKAPAGGRRGTYGSNPSKGKKRMAASSGPSDKTSAEDADKAAYMARMRKKMKK